MTQQTSNQTTQYIGPAHAIGAFRGGNIGGSQ